MLETAELFSPIRPPARLPLLFTTPLAEESLTIEEPIALPIRPPTLPEPVLVPVLWAWLIKPPLLRPMSRPTSRLPLTEPAVRVRLLMLPPLTVPKRPTPSAEGVSITRELIVWPAPSKEPVNGVAVSPSEANPWPLQMLR